MAQKCRLQEVRRQGNSRAVVFLHGFTGNEDDTWGNFPILLGSECAGWDLFKVGYATTLLPDVVGVWSADADLPILSRYLFTELGLPPLRAYAELALVAHSMGGLIVQRSLLDNDELLERVSRVVLFGTPSGGLRKASWLAFWKRSIRNMADDSEFISRLRADWQARFRSDPSFLFLTVAGTNDQFVPPTSSLDPFPRHLQRVVDGNHLDIVKPSVGSGSLRLLADVLASEVAGSLAEVSPPHNLHDVPPTEMVVVQAALELDHSGRRSEAIQLLERHVDLGTDVMGTLGGRYKRLWLESEDASLARRAHDLYASALELAVAKDDSEQIYYHALNAAFLELVAFGQQSVARDHAAVALQHIERSRETGWSLASRAEANLYLGEVNRAIELYRQVGRTEAEPWKLASTGLQAVHIARSLGDGNLLDEIDAIFSPGAKKVFVSYSHADRSWLDRLKILLKPYLESAHVEFWDDSRINSGSLWRAAIQQALDAAGVAVALASSNFLASDFIRRSELPELVAGARANRIRLIWLALDPAGYEVCPLADFQCVNDPNRPLSGLSPHEQQSVLLDAARKIKQAALGETLTQA